MFKQMGSTYQRSPSRHATERFAEWWVFTLQLQFLEILWRQSDVHRQRHSLTDILQERPDSLNHSWKKSSTILSQIFKTDINITKAIASLQPAYTVVFWLTGLCNMALLSHIFQGVSQYFTIGQQNNIFYKYALILILYQYFIRVTIVTFTKLKHNEIFK